MQVISVILDRYMLNVLSSLNLVITSPILHWLNWVKLVGFVEVRTYLTMVKKNELVLSNGLAMIDISIFALRVEIGGYFKKGIRGMTIRIWRGEEEGGYFGTWMDSRAMDVNEIFGICETWCFRVDWIREWTWPFTVSSRASQRIYFRDI